jgi:hypothetical protein
MVRTIDQWYDIMVGSEQSILRVEWVKLGAGRGVQIVIAIWVFQSAQQGGLRNALMALKSDGASFGCKK